VVGLTLITGPANAGKVALLLRRYLEVVPREPVLIVPTRPDLDAGTIHQAVTAANSRLPSYAQVRQWLRVPPFSACEGLATANGRLRRDAIERHYRDTLSSLYVDALAS